MFILSKNSEVSNNLVGYYSFKICSWILIIKTSDLLTGNFE